MRDIIIPKKLPRSTWFGGLLAASLLVLQLAGCGKKEEPAAPAAAAPEAPTQPQMVEEPSPGGPVPAKPLNQP